MKPKQLFIAIFVASSLAVILGVVDHYFSPVSETVLTLTRWLTWLLFIYWAYQKRSLTGWIVVSMMVGCEIGFSFPGVAIHLNVFSNIFLRLIKTIIAPLIFSTLVVGIAAHSNLKQVGRMGLKAIIYFEAVTTLALFIGLAAINLTKAGEGAVINIQQGQEQRAEKLLAQKQSHDVILDIFPENIAKAVADGQVLQVVVFSIFFAVALARLSEQKRKPMLEFCEGLSDVMFKFTDMVMYVAPFAVCGALAYSIASFGFDVLKNLALLVATLYAALVVFVLVVFVPIGLIIKLNFKKFIAAVTEPVTIAFSTATSESALPKAMENLEAMGIPRKVVSFVLPTGYSFNLDGSTLYLSLASVFVAQLAGVDLTFVQQIEMVVILMLTSKGVAGVRGATFLILVATVDRMGIDPHKAFVILGVDAIMDMARTGTNVLGNCLATVVVAKWEGEYKD
ncbi:MAG: cation:dicarboxylase symporter family transporter [Cytophagales bacterium]|nr:cation:dicarboxylase symporter family transporter [Bacteroidota bacterium]MBS1980601.1 cation:dicarboxylase symporter family transporter [Bacteroidota bacterium]WHZ07923.1 MAG: cation:dicarboxylase symporter family transporter [Cytophagales bacterium]